MFLQSGVVLGHFPRAYPRAFIPWLLTKRKGKKKRNHQCCTPPVWPDRSEVVIMKPCGNSFQKLKQGHQDAHTACGGVMLRRPAGRQP